MDPLVLVGLVLLVMLAVLSWLTRRVQGGGLHRARGRREQVALTGEHLVHLIEIGGVRLLVGTGPSGAPRVLAQLGEVEAVAPAEVEAPMLGRPWIELLSRFGVEGGR